MKITEVRAFLLSCPMPEPVRLPFHGGERTILKRDALYVKVSTDSGLCGFGPGAASETTAAMVNDKLSELLVGSEPGDPSCFLTETLAKLGSQAFAATGGREVA